VDLSEFQWVCRGGPRAGERCVYASMDIRFGKIVRVRFIDGTELVVPRSAVRRAK
jgi:hypothetical protein